MVFTIEETKKLIQKLIEEKDNGWHEYFYADPLNDLIKLLEEIENNDGENK
jgi:hypothetical protein